MGKHHNNHEVERPKSSTVDPVCYPIPTKELLGLQC